MHNKAEAFAQAKAQHIKEILPTYNKSEIYILDVGCGKGMMTYYLQEVFFDAQVIGADISSKNIIEAHNNYPTIKFIPYEQLQHNVFDVLVVSDVLHHIPENERGFFVQHITRYLKQSGIIIVTELNPHNKKVSADFQRNPLEQDAHMISSESLKDLLQHYYANISCYMHYSKQWYVIKGDKSSSTHFVRSE